MTLQSLPYSGSLPFWVGLPFDPCGRCCHHPWIYWLLSIVVSGTEKGEAPRQTCLCCPPDISTNCSLQIRTECLLPTTLHCMYPTSRVQFLEHIFCAVNIFIILGTQRPPTPNIKNTHKNMTSWIEDINHKNTTHCQANNEEICTQWHDVYIREKSTTFSYSWDADAEELTKMLITHDFEQSISNSWMLPCKLL